MIESLAAVFKVFTLIAEFTSTLRGPGGLRARWVGNSKISQMLSLAMAWCGLLQSLRPGGRVAAGR